MKVWPYPPLFAHRLGGALAPENTLAGLELAAALGVRAVECDVKLSADGVPFLLHDDTLERTTDGAGAARDWDWDALARLDAGMRHHRAFAGERLPTLEQLAAACRRHDIRVNLEIKPCPGRERETGAAVAQAAARLWQGVEPAPLLSSFEIDALYAARDAEPALPRALLLDEWDDDWLALLQGCGAVALHANAEVLNAERVAAVRGAGYAMMAYTVNDAAQARQLRDWGVDMLCSDRPERLRAL